MSAGREAGFSSRSRSTVANENRLRVGCRTHEGVTGGHAKFTSSKAQLPMPSAFGHVIEDNSRK